MFSYETSQQIIANPNHFNWNHPCPDKKHEQRLVEIGARGLTPLLVRQPLRRNQGVADDLRTPIGRDPNTTAVCRAVELWASGPSQNCRR
jgi:hypothetical protein